MTQRHFVVVGAGLGGLAVALRLSHRGHRVTVLEKTDQVGGRNRRIQVGQCTFDAGPTLMMMMDPFRKLFADVGESLDEVLAPQLCDPSYRVFYADGTRLDGTTNVAEMAARIRAFSGPRDEAGFRRLLPALKSLYEDAIPNFVRKNFDTPLDFFGPKQLIMVAKHRMLANLAGRVAKYVQDPRLRMLFSFQTMYLGLSPYDAPWVYAVLTHMEYGEGIYFPRGGMVEICRSVARLAEARGAEIRLNCPVARIEGNTAILMSGERIEADSIVLNADLPYAERVLLGGTNEPGADLSGAEVARQTGRRSRRTYSCSAYMLYFDYDGQLPDLLHHNVFFGPDFKGNLDAIFHWNQVPKDPAFYACVSGRSEPSHAPEGRENLYLLIPCANLDRPFTREDAGALREAALNRLEAEIGFDRNRIAAEADYSPIDWARDLNLDRGAAFGLSHHFLQSAFFRPSNRCRKNPAVTYVGASTVPGNGLPMVLISAELAEKRLEKAGLLN